MKSLTLFALAGCLSFTAAQLNFVRETTDADFFAANPLIHRALDPLNSKDYYLAGQVADSDAKYNITRYNSRVFANSACYVDKFDKNGNLLWSTLIPLHKPTTCFSNCLPISPPSYYFYPYCSGIATVHPDGQSLWIQASTFTGGSLGSEPAAPSGKALSYVLQLCADDGTIQWIKLIGDATVGNGVSLFQALRPIYEPTSKKLYVARSGSLLQRTFLTASNAMVARLSLGSSPTESPLIDWTQTFGGANCFIQNWTITPASSAAGQKLFLFGFSTADGSFNGQTVSGGSDLLVARLSLSTGALESSRLYGGNGFDLFAPALLYSPNPITNFNNPVPLIYDSQSDSFILSGTTNSSNFNGSPLNSAGRNVFVMRVPVQNIVSPAWTRFLSSNGAVHVPFAIIHPFTRKIYVVGTVEGNISASTVIASKGFSDIFVGVFNLEDGVVNTLQLYGTASIDFAYAANFEPNGRLVVLGSWNNLGAWLADDSTIVAAPEPLSTVTVRMTQTIIATPNCSPNTPSGFLDSFLADSLSKQVFLGIFCTMLVLQLVMFGCLIYLVYHRRSPSMAKALFNDAAPSRAQLAGSMSQVTYPRNQF